MLVFVVESNKDFRNKTKKNKREGKNGRVEKREGGGRMNEEKKEGTKKEWNEEKGE
jgi:hypothetical protein